jgi:exo-beta-1,3-glucanase (GH17 family)/cellulose synthase/poly-beta-1,6-N-acetylglucosamine synthase-like glycosyltransferase
MKLDLTPSLHDCTPSERPAATTCIEVPDWPERVCGFTYAPFRPGQSPHLQRFPSREQITEDLLLIRRFTRSIRTYSVESTLSLIPEVADELGMEVTLGVWVSADEKSSRAELETAIELCNRVASIKRLLVGNEVLYRGDVPLSELINYLDEARSRVDIPVAGSEVWVQWLETPELAMHSDFIAAHILPFWEGLPVNAADAFVLARAEELQQTFPDKPLVISEVGWPSRNGKARWGDGCAAAQSVYLRTQLALLNQKGYQYFVIEAFDQPWKTDEGLVGPHWGVFSAQRRLKVQLSGPVHRPTDWQARRRTLLAFMRPRSWRAARASLIVALCLLATTGTWAGLREPDPLPLWLGLPLSALWATCLLVGLVVESHEYLEACWGQARRRHFQPRRLKAEQMTTWPRVALHVPCYNEPAQLVNATLDCLRTLDYPNFEVLVIDNNTPDEKVWRPVEHHCKKLGPHFRFFHVAPLSGFKAGALNYLLDRTSSDCEIIAVIDADYRVNRHWLKHMVPHFQDPAIAVIQSPQDYRDAGESLFKRCCRAEYRGFFVIGMVIRNDHDAIIQHGTMTLIRRTALEQLRWAQWSICEDAELGLRMLEQGYSTGYAPVSYGQGLIPDTFGHFKKQRYRWAYGAVQIVKRHAGSLFTGQRSKLTPMQRYHFLAGWVPWAAEGLNYLLTLAALCWSAAMILKPETCDPPPWLFSTSLLVLLAVRALKVLGLYSRLVSSDLREAPAALLAGMALYTTIGKAVLAGLFTSRLPFHRTPKHAESNRYAQALLEVREELALVSLGWLASAGLWATSPAVDTDLALWTAMLLAQSLPNLAAVVMALLSAHAGRLAPATL